MGISRYVPPPIEDQSFRFHCRLETSQARNDSRKVSSRRKSKQRASGAPIVLLRVRYRRSCCRTGPVVARQLMTRLGVRQESWQRIGGESPPRGRSSQPPRPRVMHEVLLARAAVKRSQGRPRAKY